MARIILLWSGTHYCLLKGRLLAHGKLKSVFLMFNLLSEHKRVSLERDLGPNRLQSLQRRLVRCAFYRRMMYLIDLLLVSDQVLLVWTMILNHFEVTSLFLLWACVHCIIFVDNLKMRRLYNLWDLETSAHNMRESLLLFSVWKIHILFVLRFPH